MKERVNSSAVRVVNSWWSTPSSTPERPTFIAIAPRTPAITKAGTMVVRNDRIQRRSTIPIRQKIPMRDRPKSADTVGLLPVPARPAWMADRVRWWVSCGEDLRPI